MEATVELRRLLGNIVRIGTIEAVDHEAARVRFRDGDLLSSWRPWLALRAGQTRTWNPPTTGEQAIMLSAGGDPADSVVLTGLYSAANPAPSESKHLDRTIYPDGAVIEYDHDKHRLYAQIPGTADISAAGDIAAKTDGSAVLAADGDVSITASQTTINGPLHVTDEITTDADVIAGAVTLLTHTHPGVRSGDSTTGPPS